MLRTLMLNGTDVANDLLAFARDLVRAGIPTIGFGPGDHKLAHMRDENCPVEQIVAACEVYTRMINRM